MHPTNIVSVYRVWLGRVKPSLKTREGRVKTERACVCTNVVHAARRGRCGGVGKEGAADMRGQTEKWELIDRWAYGRGSLPCEMS
jgi:hypothetical protein